MASRDPRLSRAKLFQTVAVVLFMIPCFWQLNDYSDPVSVASMVGAMYFLTMMQMLFNFLPTVVVFQGEKPIYVRERDSGMYDIWIYATTKHLAEMPVMLLVPLLLNTCIYFAIGFQNNVGEFVEFYLILAMMVQAATGLGYFLSSVFNQETTAVACVPLFNIPLTLVAGYLINLKGIFQQTPQKYFAWLMYFSPLHYAFTGMMVAQFPVDGYPLTEDVLVEYGFDGRSYWACFFLLTLLALGCRVMVVISLMLQDLSFSVGASGDQRNQNIVPRSKPLGVTKPLN